MRTTRLWLKNAAVGPIAPPGGVPKGIILSGNDVFVRMSGYSRETLVGAAHNIIRHPDIPQAVFKLLWDYLEAGKPFAGYVKNMAADGGFYWVTVLVVPIPQGYLSVRFKPSTALLPVVDGVYAQMLAVEKAAATAPGGVQADTARHRIRQPSRPAEDARRQHGGGCGRVARLDDPGVRQRRSGTGRTLRAHGQLPRRHQGARRQRGLHARARREHAPGVAECADWFLFRG